MNRTFYALIAIMACVFSSCGVGEAEDTASEFHKKLDNREYMHIVENMIDKETLEETGEAEWFEVFEYVEATWGTAESRNEDFDFESAINNGITTVELNYTVNYPSKTMYERLFLVDRGSGFRVTGFFLNETKAGLDEQAGNQ
ncbi:MAG: hypothetical protein HYZ14_03300 [Bacteroidetes bacterium]|nr:hypothetical protein [Bacteroidota bacterium]